MCLVRRGQSPKGRYDLQRRWFWYLESRGSGFPKLRWDLAMNFFQVCMNLESQLFTSLFLDFFPLLVKRGSKNSESFINKRLEISVQRWLDRRCKQIFFVLGESSHLRKRNVWNQKTWNDIMLEIVISKMLFEFRKRNGKEGGVLYLLFFLRARERRNRVFWRDKFWLTQGKCNRR